MSCLTAANGPFDVRALNVLRLFSRLKRRQSPAGESLPRTKALNSMFTGKTEEFVREAVSEKIHFRQKDDLVNSCI
jgi:hypothetical protein